MNVLILEDEPLIAMAMAALVEDEGWSVVGPFSVVADAVAAIAGGAAIDCALLDCNLGNAPSWPVADLLAARDIPFAFSSGQAAADIEPRFADRPCFAKPIDETKVKLFLAGQAAARISG